MQLFEPTDTFETNLAQQQDQSLKRVGENPAYDSSDESEEDIGQKSKSNQQQLENEYQSIAKRGFVARRGRNG